jgi:uncharacterized protein (TIGR00645 family)
MAASAKSRVERALEQGLFLSRWLMAPFYIGMVIALLALLAVFVEELVHELPGILTMKPEDAILLALSLIDLSLAGNLLLIVMFAGYENFVSRIEIDAEDRPDWMGKVNFSGLKMKLSASIVAISGIALLRAFMELGEGAHVDHSQLMWMAAIHLVFVVSGVLLALMDWLNTKSDAH